MPSRACLARPTSLLLVLLLAATAGCGSGRPKTYPVSGRVTVAGKPLRTGDIMLVPESGRTVTSVIEDGKFQLSTFDENDGAPPGTYKVVVTGSVAVGKEIRTTVPDRYFSAETSDKTVTIDGPTDSLTIDLTWGSERPRVLYR